MLKTTNVKTSHLKNNNQLTSWNSFEKKPSLLGDERKKYAFIFCGCGERKNS